MPCYLEKGVSMQNGAPNPPLNDGLEVPKHTRVASPMKECVDNVIHSCKLNSYRSLIPSLKASLNVRVCRVPLVHLAPGSTTVVPTQIIMKP